MQIKVRHRYIIRETIPYYYYGKYFLKDEILTTQEITISGAFFRDEKNQLLFLHNFEFKQYLQEMEPIDLYHNFKCLDCKITYRLSGSTAINLIICPVCQSKNHEYIRDCIKPLK